jgi:DHA1 family multidrug resistance protein-like MFS transporter
MEITFKDPTIIFLQIYTSSLYGADNLYFKVFPIVYEEFYGMTVGQIGIVFQ